MVLLYPESPKATQLTRWIDVIAAMNVLPFPASMLSFNGQNASGAFPTEATR